MTEYCDHCDKEQVEYRLCQECMDDLTGSYEEEIKDLERERDKLLEACKAMLPIVIGARTIKGKNPDECPVVCMARAAISDGKGEEE
jgi:hypothetical protein